MQSYQKDKKARRWQPYVIATISNPSDSKGMVQDIFKQVNLQGQGHKVRNHGMAGLVWFGFLRIYVDLAVFQPYLDLEAGDNQSLKIQVARPGIEPRSSCSASQELNHSATAAPSWYGIEGLAKRNVYVKYESPSRPLLVKTLWPKLFF